MLFVHDECFKGGCVLKFIVNALGLIAALVLSSAAGAVGMGGISVATALGEPLKAEIDLVSVGKTDKNKMSARLASPDAFKGAGLEYPSTLPSMKFQVETRANGQPFLKLTTSQPVNEPFVSLLVELTWPSGQLLREYTFLLDPPGFKPEQPKAQEIQPLEPIVVRANESGAPARKEEPLPLRATAPMDEKVLAASGVASAKKTVESSKPAASRKVAESTPVESNKPAARSIVATGSIKVKPGDTLSKLARETKAPDISLERMLVAMYRANEDEFDGKNMNRLQTGKILRVPEENEVSKVAQEDAVKEIRAQAADWNAYRLKLATAIGTSSEQAPKQIVTGKISTTVADKTPAAKESAREVVRLSRGATPGDKATAGGKAMQDKLHAMEEDATARNKTLKDSNERIALLEKNIKEMQHLIELKGQLAQSAKTAQSKAEESIPNKTEAPEIKPAITPSAKQDAVSATVKTTTLAASAVKPAKPAQPKVDIPPPPSLLDEILGEPLYLAGGAAALLGLGGLGFMLTRRRSKVVKNKEQISAVTNIVAPVAPSPDTGDFTQISTTDNITSPVMAVPEDVDPLTEADLFLNFGRDAQAEEILKDALNKNPDNQKIRLKLLSIYANRKDAKTFASLASEIQTSGDAEAWGQASEMGRKLEPGNPLYGGEGGSVEPGGAAPLAEVSTGQAAPSLDFDLGIAAPEDASATLDVPLEVPTPALSEELDFDLGLTVQEESSPAVAEQENIAEQSPQQEEKAETSLDLDFDLGLNAPVETAAPPASDEMAYESTMILSEPINQEVEATESSQTGQDAPLDFDITSGQPDLSVSQPEAALEQVEPPKLEQNESASEMQSPSEPLSPEPNEIAAAEQPAKPEEEMTFSLDFPVEESPSDDKTEPDTPIQTATVDLSDINLNLDETVSAPAEEVKDTHWHDVATKLDLARAYQEMGDSSGASEILQEVLNEGDAQQRAAAEVMLQQLSV